MFSRLGFTHFIHNRQQFAFWPYSINTIQPFQPTSFTRPLQNGSIKPTSRSQGYRIHGRTPRPPPTVLKRPRARAARPAAAPKTARTVKKAAEKKIASPTESDCASASENEVSNPLRQRICLAVASDDETAANADADTITAANADADTITAANTIVAIANAATATTAAKIAVTICTRIAKRKAAAITSSSSSEIEAFEAKKAAKRAREISPSLGGSRVRLTRGQKKIPSEAVGGDVEVAYALMKDDGAVVKKEEFGAKDEVKIDDDNKDIKIDGDAEVHKN